METFAHLKRQVRRVSVARVERRVRQRLSLRRICALVAVAVLPVALPACAAGTMPTSSAARSTGAAAAVTSTPTPATLLTWHTISVPPHYQPPNAGGGGGQPIMGLPGDGTTAWVCTVADPVHGSPPLPWVTHDAGASWQPLSVPTSVQPAYSCGIDADGLDPHIATLSAASSTSAPYADGYSLLTLDGGLTWRTYETWSANPYALPPAELEMLTLNGTTYEVRQAQAGPDLAAHLAISTDQLGTWQDIDGAIIAAGQQPYQFWINQSTGALLVLATVGVTGATVFHWWTSADRGQHWSNFTAPALNLFAVQTPTGSQPWHICILPPGAATAITCSVDGGSSWVPAPPLPASLQDVRLVAVASDGAVVVQGSIAVGTSLLYRLPSGAAQWQLLGAAPQSFVEYDSSPDGGVLWATPLNGVSIDGQGNTYTAAYPA